MIAISMDMINCLMYTFWPFWGATLGSSPESFQGHIIYGYTCRHNVLHMLHLQGKL